MTILLTKHSVWLFILCDVIFISGSGACAKICIHRCIPSCNLACCVDRPIGMNRHIINKLEVEAAKKITETGSKKSIVGSKEKLYLSKEDMEKGTTCDKKCLIHCDPSCKFKCCIRVPRGWFFYSLKPVFLVSIPTFRTGEIVVSQWNLGYSWSSCLFSKNLDRKLKEN